MTTSVAPRSIAPPKPEPMVGLSAEEVKGILDKFHHLFVEALREGKCTKTEQHFLYLRDISEKFPEFQRLEVHQILTKDIIDYLRTKVIPVINKQKTDESFFNKLLSCYGHYRKGMDTICRALIHITDYFISSFNLDPIKFLFTHIWREFILEYGNNANAKRLQKFMLKITADWRKGDIEEAAKLDLQGACLMLLEVGNFGNRTFFEQLFARPFISQTADYYRAESKSYLSMDESPDVYANKVNQKSKEEEEFVETYIDTVDSDTKDKLKHVMEIELITKHVDTIMAMGKTPFCELIVLDKTEEIHCVYQILKRGAINGMAAMRKAISTYLRDCGTKITSNKNIADDPSKFIDSLIALKERFDQFLKAFEGDADLKKCIQEEFEYFVNLHDKAADFLVMFIDERLRKGLDGMEDTDIDQIFERALIVFQFVHDKDVFEQKYNEFLSKRLLSLRGVSVEMEKLMLAKLKGHLGGQSKLEGMFRDMLISDTLMEGYKWMKKWSGDDKKYIDLDIRVLNSGFWPTISANVPPCLLPPCANSSFAHFTNYYTSKHSNRKLTLNPELGAAEIEAEFYAERFSEKKGPLSVEERGDACRKYKFTTSTYQMTVLLLFNSHNKLSYEEIKDLTGMFETPLKAALHSLSMFKTQQRVLCRQSQGRSMGKGDQFWVNESFFNKFHHVKIQSAPPREIDLQEQKAKFEAKVEKDRRCELEAAIVRIMKRNKKMVESLLIAEVIQEVKDRFTPVPETIKKRIDHLVNLDYLAQDEEEKTMYSYVA